MSFLDYVDYLRMCYAKDLLENTDLSVTEIAMECGFSSVSFFIRRFTGTNGCSPLKWRKMRTSYYRLDERIEQRK